MGVVGNRLVDDLDRDHTVQHGVPGLVDRPLAARGYPFEDFVSAYSLEHGWPGIITGLVSEGVIGAA